MKLKHIIGLILLALLGCEDVITLDLPENQNLLVVEGWVTNEERRQVIRISRTQKFDEQSADTSVPNAVVTVQRDTIIYRYSYQPSGVYLSDSAFMGAEGSFYGLQVILPAGDTIRSRSFERMPEIVQIDRLEFDFLEQRSEADPNQLERVYFPITFSIDPPEKANFYRYVIARNDTIFSNPQDIELLDDSAINGNRFRNEFRTFNFKSGDLVSIELRSISREAFQFFQLLRNQSTSLGTSSGTAPASIEGNLLLQNNPGQQVLGYFGCYSSSKVEVVFQE